MQLWSCVQRSGQLGPIALAASLGLAAGIVVAPGRAVDCDADCSRPGAAELSKALPTSRGPRLPVSEGAATLDQGSSDAEVPEADTDNGQQGEEARARAVIASLSHQLHVGANAIPEGELTVEAEANQLDPYLKGWGDAVMLLAPTQLRALGPAITHALCATSLDDADIVILSRVVLRFGRQMPEAAEALRCVLSSRTGEDIVTWTAIDAWSRAGYPLDEVWSEWQATARDQRTIRRLRTWAERMNDPERLGTSMRAPNAERLQGEMK